MLRGNLPAKMDAKGRLKIPASFRKLIEDAYGDKVFVTSLNGQSARIYPSPVWEELETKVGSPPLMRPEKVKFLERANYWGQETIMDNQGRVLLQKRLREVAQLNDEVAVLGNVNYLEVWNHAALRERMEADPFTDEDAARLADALGSGKV